MKKELLILKEEFIKEYKSDNYNIYLSPSRINLIGEHIDYNGGKVLPCTIGKNIIALACINDDNIINIKSLNFNNSFHINLFDIKMQEYDKKYDWANYAFGVFRVLSDLGYKISSGFNIILSSNIPIASGLSSSASLLVLITYIVNDLFKLNIKKMDIAKIAKKVENEYCHVKSGIMDEAIIALGKKNKCMLLDCNSLSYEYHDIFLKDYALVVLQTNKERRLITSKYNERVKECETGLDIIKKHYDVNNIVDITLDELDKIKNELDDTIYKRLRHVISENKRVNMAIKYLDNGDINSFAHILNESHESLKNDYEVSGIELDTIVSLALSNKALGARMTGAGFGGCAIAIIKQSDFKDFKKNVIRDYYKLIHTKANVFKVRITSSVRKVK